MTDEEIDRMADDFVNAQVFTRVYSVARKAECGAFWKYGFLAGLKAERKEATQRLKNCMNCGKRRTCKTWHLVCGLEAANTANYDCVCLDKWEIAEECEEEE